MEIVRLHTRQLRVTGNTLHFSSVLGLLSVHAEVDIPHLSFLGRLYSGGSQDEALHAPVSYKHRRCNGKQSLAENAHIAVQRLNYARSWEEYINGNVPSEYLADLISSMLVTFKCSRRR